MLRLTSGHGKLRLIGSGKGLAMRIVVMFLWAVAVGLIGPRELASCKLPPRVAPTIFTVATPNKEFVVAVVESPDRYRRSGYVLDTTEARILDRYPRSGVYRVGTDPQLLWELPGWFDPLEVHSFFSRDGSVRLVLGNDSGLQFFADGELINKASRSELFSTPWRAGPAYCGGPAGLDVNGTSSGRKPSVAVTTNEGGRFVFDAATGALVSERGPRLMDHVGPTPEERELAGVISGFTDLATVPDLSAVALASYGRDGPFAIHDCSVEVRDEQWLARLASGEATILSDSYQAMWLVPWRSTLPIDVEVQGLARVSLPQSLNFAMY